MNRFFPKNIHYTLKTTKLLHDSKNNIFSHDITHDVKGNFKVKIEYKKVDNLFVLHHTEVPKEHRGLNLGYFIAEEVFDYLLEHNIKTVVQCPFLIKYVEKYPREKLNSIIKK